MNITTQEAKEAIAKTNWFHSIDIPIGDAIITTPGRMPIDHCSQEAINNRFGIPQDLTGKTVLDVGCWDGLFSFEAEKRGAIVTAIDPYQNPNESNSGFFTAKRLLNSKVKFHQESLSRFYELIRAGFDVVFYFGVLYHVLSPIKELSYLYHVTGEYALIETAIARRRVGAVWEFQPVWNDDRTSYFFPTVQALESALYFVGFKRVETIFNMDNIRVTLKAYK